MSGKRITAYARATVTVEVTGLAGVPRVTTVCSEET